MPDIKPDSVAPVMTELPGDAVLSEKEMREFQKRNTVAALKQTNWRVSGEGGAADLLGVKPTTLADRIRSFGIKRPSRR